MQRAVFMGMLFTQAAASPAEQECLPGAGCRQGASPLAAQGRVPSRWAQEMLRAEVGPDIASRLPVPVAVPPPRVVSSLLCV